MLKIGICDGNERHQLELHHLLERILFDITDCTYCRFRDGYEVLEYLDSKGWDIDLLFIDIILPNLNGLKTVSELRTRNVASDIIFLTELEQYVFEGYTYHAYDFLVKPATAKSIDRVMQRYIKERISSARHYLSLRVGGCAQKIRLSGILYFESDKRKVRAITAGDAVEFYSKMQVLLDQVSNADFIRCHQSYIVNKNHVISLQTDSLQMDNGDRIPVSRAYLSEVRDAFHRA